MPNLDKLLRLFPGPKAESLTVRQSKKQDDDEFIPDMGLGLPQREMRSTRAKWRRSY